MNTANGLLDIHTHKQDVDSGNKSIINYQPLATPSFREGCYYSVGIHPWDLTIYNFEQQLDFLIDHLPNKQIVAIGEAGLDKLAEAPKALQMMAFMRQLELAKANDLPMIIHCVKAMEDLLMVKRKYASDRPWIWHGFRGKPEQAKQLLQKGFYLSFGEFYPEETMRLVPDESLFLETDDSSLDIEDILCRAAKVRGVEVEELRATVRKNIQKVFFKA